MQPSLIRRGEEGQARGSAALGRSAAQRVVASDPEATGIEAT